MPELGLIPLLEGANALMIRNRPVGVRVPSWHPSDPKPLQGSSYQYGVSQTVVPPTASQVGASQNMETMVQGLVSLA